MDVTFDAYYGLVQTEARLSRSIGREQSPPERLNTARPRPWTPAQEPPSALEYRTVGRDALVQTLAQRLTSAAQTRSRPHTLLVGPPGSGKTHLIQVALHRLRKGQETRNRLTVADIGEDAAFGMTSYADLLCAIGASLDVRIDRSDGVVAMEDALLAAAADRTLVIVLENLDRVFDAIGFGGQQNLRSWVETSGRIMVLATTRSMFPGVADRTHPWFAGLITTRVDPLSPEAACQLLILLARNGANDQLEEFLTTTAGQAQVQAAAHHIGGSPRNWMLLSDGLTAQSLQTLTPALESVSERLTPYYQQRIWGLPRNHQAVMRELAGSQQARTVADIASSTSLSEHTVSKVLSLLQNTGWVSADKRPPDRRHTWYQLREPMVAEHFRHRRPRAAPDA